MTVGAANAANWATGPSGPASAESPSCAPNCATTAGPCASHHRGLVGSNTSPAAADCWNSSPWASLCPVRMRASAMGEGSRRLVAASRNACRASSVAGGGMSIMPRRPSGSWRTISMVPPSPMRAWPVPRIRLATTSPSGPTSESRSAEGRVGWITSGGGNSGGGRSRGSTSGGAVSGSATATRATSAAAGSESPAARSWASKDAIRDGKSRACVSRTSSRRRVIRASAAGSRSSRPCTPSAPCSAMIERSRPSRSIEVATSLLPLEDLLDLRGRVAGLREHLPRRRLWQRAHESARDLDLLLRQHARRRHCRRGHGVAALERQAGATGRLGCRPLLLATNAEEINERLDTGRGVVARNELAAPLLGELTRHRFIARLLRDAERGAVIQVRGRKPEPARDDIDRDAGLGPAARHRARIREVLLAPLLLDLVALPGREPLVRVGLGQGAQNLAHTLDRHVLDRYTAAAHTRADRLALCQPLEFVLRA